MAYEVCLVLERCTLQLGMKRRLGARAQRLHAPGPRDVISFVGQRQGREQCVRRFAAFAEAQDAEKFEVRDFIAQGNKSRVYHS